MLYKTIKFYILISALFSFGFLNFAAAEEVTPSVEETNLNNNDALTSPAPTSEEIQSRLDLFEKNAPVSLKIYNTENLVSGSEINIKSKIYVFTETDVSNFNFTWSVRKNGMDQDLPASSSGRGKDRMRFVPTSSGNYEVRVKVADAAGTVRESQPLTIPVGDALMVDFEPLKPAKDEMVKMTVSGFNNPVVYSWFLDDELQDASGPNFEFEVTKYFEDRHMVKVAVTSSDGIVSSKDVIIPVYRSQIVLKPEADGVAVAGSAGRSNEFLMKGESPIVVNAEVPNFADPSQIKYVWSVNGQKVDEGVGKSSIVIDPKEERFNKSRKNEYLVTVMASSPDLKNVASSQVSINRISDTSSLASVSPEKLPNQPLLAESKSFLTSFATLRKLILPVLVVLFVAVAALANTQPVKLQEIEEGDWEKE